MTLVLPLLSLSLPALVAWVLLGRAGVAVSGLLRAAMAWFLGEAAATTVTFAVATALRPFTHSVLEKAALVTLALAAAALVAMGRRLAASLRGLGPPFGRAAALRLALLAACAVFSWEFFSRHIAQTPTEIWRSGVYWDFNIHYPAIQNFVYGDNFPPQNESFAGAPLTYHFFYDLLTAVPVALGWNLATAVTAVSAAAFLALLALVAGFAEEFAGSLAAGAIAVALVLTSSSLRFLDFFASRGARSPAELWRCVWENAEHPYFFSFLRWNPDHYNGAMFNLFYFVAERQLIFGTGLLLTALALLASRRRWTPRACALVGAGLGLVLLWHLFMAAAIGATLAVLLLLAPERRRTAFVLGGWAAVVLCAALVGHSILARPEWFAPEALAGPRFNTGFTVPSDGPPATPREILGYYGYAYGLKLALFPLGLLLAWRRRRELFFLLFAATVPMFLLVNTVQLRPTGIYDNHKWLRPMNVLVDIGVAALLVSRPARRPLTGGLALSALLALLTLSGIIELVPFFRTRPVYRYAAYPTDFTRAIRDRTPPGATFLSREARALHLAGRKLFLGSTSGPLDAPPLFVVARNNVLRRRRITAAIYASESAGALCDLAVGNGIDFVEVPAEPDGNPVLRETARRGELETTADDGRPIHFLDVRQACRGTPASVSVPAPD